ncbi:hypothetical protein C1646_773784 [Rhizophagus diaphanus]|nr:hypothetical protein C1646_773784 [Rhizophagus diaphanus] [Rhizophagus sp. MUCL 43196]
MSFTIWVKYNNEQAVSVEFQTGTVDKLQPWNFEASGLECISDNDEITKVITSLEKIEPGERYQIVASITTIRKDVAWSQIEDKAIEDETLLAKHIENLINRLSEFQNKLVITDSFEFKRLLGKQHVGVSCEFLGSGEQPQNDKEAIVEVLPEVTVSNIDLFNTVIDQRDNVDTKTSEEMEMDAFFKKSICDKFRERKREKNVQHKTIAQRLILT